MSCAAESPLTGLASFQCLVYARTWGNISCSILAKTSLSRSYVKAALPRMLDLLFAHRPTSKWAISPWTARRFFGRAWVSFGLDCPKTDPLCVFEVLLVVTWGLWVFAVWKPVLLLVGAVACSVLLGPVAQFEFNNSLQYLFIVLLCTAWPCCAANLYAGCVFEVYLVFQVVTMTCGAKTSKQRCNSH